MTVSTSLFFRKLSIEFYMTDAVCNVFILCQNVCEHRNAAKIAATYSHQLSSPTRLWPLTLSVQNSLQRIWRRPCGFDPSWAIAQRPIVRSYTQTYIQTYRHTQSIATPALKYADVGTDNLIGLRNWLDDENRFSCRHWQRTSGCQKHTRSTTALLADPLGKMGLPGGKGRKEDKVEFIPYTPSPAATNLVNSRVLSVCLCLHYCCIHSNYAISTLHANDGRFMPTAAAQRSGEVSVWPPSRRAVILHVWYRSHTCNYGQRQQPLILSPLEATWTDGRPPSGTIKYRTGTK